MAISTDLITNGAVTTHAPINIVTNADSKTITVDFLDVTTTAGSNGGIFTSTTGTGGIDDSSSRDATDTMLGNNIACTGPLASMR